MDGPEGGVKNCLGAFVAHSRCFVYCVADGDVSIGTTKMQMGGFKNAQIREHYIHRSE